MKFADTGWWVAWALPSDSRHADALAMLARLGRTEQMLTTNHVVGETWTFLRRRAGHAYGTAYLDRIETLRSGHGLVVTHVTEDLEQRAMRWLRTRDERSYSFVDATSFEVMRQRRLREALAFDGDFAAAGFVHVLP
ncbi:type II toxin-antitoxin system VapC family toxin [Candidatus Poriferisodalis sp.]|uniref:type II toxin-antitoxin system VapC family toxin n=1 Tax=Candidatus Poriferisodalis sp. TaxID=3101277 RepID=UPI003B59DB9F